MVSSCAAIGCTNRQSRAGIKLYRFPVSKKRSKKWLVAMKRDKWKPNEYSRLCSAHFVSGKPSRNPFNVDYVPSIFSFCGNTVTQPIGDGATSSISSVYTLRNGRKVVRDNEVDLENHCGETINQTGIVEETNDEDVTQAIITEEEEVNIYDDEERNTYDEDAEVNIYEDVYEKEEDIYEPWQDVHEEEEDTTHTDDEEGTDFQLETGKEIVVGDTEVESVFGDTETVELVCADKEVEREGECSNGLGNEIVNDTFFEDEIHDNQTELGLLESKEVEIGELQLELDQMQREKKEIEDENHFLKQELALRDYLQQHMASNSLNLERKLKLQFKFGAISLKDDDVKTCFYTGLPSYRCFLGVFKLLEPIIGNSRRNIPHQDTLLDEYLLVLIKLRLGLPNADLAYRMNTSLSAVSRIFRTWISVMSIELRCLIAWPDEEALRKNMPICFKKHFSKVICIIDCFEIFIERPVYFEARAQTFSNYKKHNTLKFLIAVTPTGSISFISQAWGGRVSDKIITQRCGFLDFLKFGDEVLADRGFNIHEDLALCGAALRIPAFTRGKNQLSQSEVEKTRQLATVRIHVERVIGQLRKKYKILSHTLPISLIKSHSDSNKALCTIDQILIVTAALTNLNPSVVS